MLPRRTSPQNLLVSWQGTASLPSLEGAASLPSLEGLARALGSGPQSWRQGGPKHWMLAAGLDSWLVHSWAGAMPAASHSQDTERSWEPPSQEAEH